MIGFGLGLPTVVTAGGDNVTEATLLVDDSGNFLFTDDNEYILTLQLEAGYFGRWSRPERNQSALWGTPADITVR